MTIECRRAVVADIAPETLYRILHLRVAVFVVEQEAAYDDLDGRDIEPGAELLWIEEGARVLATARILREPPAADAPVALRIGRVATAVEERSRGLAGEIMRAAVARCLELDPGLPILLGAQEDLVGWYARFGFEPDGERYHEDGIPHRPMRRAPSPDGD